MTNEEALRILHCPSAYLTDEDSEFAHIIPLFSKAYGQAMAVAFEALKQADGLDKIKAEIKGMTPTYHNFDWSITDLVPISEVLKIVDKYKAESEDKE